jgi:hypothetical protein
MYRDKTLADLAYHGLDYLSTIQIIRQGMFKAPLPGNSNGVNFLEVSSKRFDIQIKV